MSLTEFGKVESVGHTLELRVDNIRYAVKGHQLEIFRGQTCLASLNLIPRTVKPLRASTFRLQGNRIWAGLEGGVEGKAVLELKDGRVTYRVETNVEHFDKLTYFPDSVINGDLWHTFIWMHWDRPWGLEEDVSVRVGDCRPDTIDPREGVIVDPGDTPPLWPGRGGPRVTAMHNPDYGWWGICVPGPVPVCDTYFNMQGGKFEVLFDYLSPGCEDGFMPAVVLVLPLPNPNDPYSVMGAMWDLCEPWRLIPGRDYKQTSFACMPICHPWEAMQHAAGNSWADPIPPVEKGSPMNPDFLLELLHELVTLEPSLKWHFLLPQGWYKCIGDFSVGENFGGEEGFRNLADVFRQGGHLLTVHGRFHHFNNRSQIGREHPEWVAPLRPGRPKPYWSPNEELEGVIEIMDVTREEIREHLKTQIRRFLSDKPGCLNMDGLNITGDNWPSSLDYKLSNEKYGVGDLLSYKLNRELFLYGKSVRPYAWLGWIGNHPLYGMCSVVGTMEDHLPVPINTASQLRLITNLYPTTRLNLVSYCMTRTKALTFWPLSVAVGAPEVDNPRAFSSPTLDANWIPIDETYRRRLHSVLVTYANSPVTSDTVNVPARVEQMGLRLEVFAARRRTEGPLAGFYSALSLGSHTVVTYSETKAMVSSTKNRIVSFPLPPGKRIKAVERMTHEGKLLPHEYSMREEGNHIKVTLHMEDCGGETKYVQVRY